MSIQILIIKLQNKKSTSERLKKYISKIHVKIAVTSPEKVNITQGLSYIIIMNMCAIRLAQFLMPLLFKVHYSMFPVIIHFSHGNFLMMALVDSVEV